MARRAQRLALLVSAGLAACGQPPADDDHGAGRQTTDDNPQHPQIRAGRASPRFTLARVREGASVALRERPGGSVVERVGDSTEFGTPRVLAVVRRSRGWLGARVAELGNRRVVWFKPSRATRIAHTRTWIVADLSRRTVELRRGRKLVERARVGVGRPGSPTPTGRFAVTDKLRGARFSRYYGRFIVALSGRQPRTPPGWTGGDRLAIHGTNDPGRVGRRSSAGCLVAADPAIASLAERVPLGAPVVIRH